MRPAPWTHAGTFLALLLVLHSCSSTQDCVSGPLCGVTQPDPSVFTNVTEFGGHTYAETRATLTWVSARDLAVAHSGHLVTITSAAESQFIEANYHNEPAPWPPKWIGMSDRTSEGNWVWVSGEPYVFTHWAESQPDDAGSAGEDCGELFDLSELRGIWNDAPCDLSRTAVVEFQ